MKQKLTFLLTVLCLLTGTALFAQARTEASINFAEQGFENGQDLDGIVIDIDDNVTVVFNKGTGSNPPKYYNTGTAIRVYGGNNFVVASTGSICSITLSFASGEGSNEITTEVGTFESPTWTGEANEVTFTIEGTSGHRRICAMTVTYDTGGQQPTVATPTFDPAGGSYYDAQSVSISCTTENAEIRYTTDGTDPTETSSLYTSPLTINETTTVKAKAWKEGYTASNIASATYTFPTLLTIAEARALEVNEYALVQGVVNFIDNRNIYVQDATGGICLFLNSGTVPSELALGDMVQAYGKRANYNGLKELSNINGNNSDEFDILSSNNPLPLATKTIAEINESGDEALQCTRVMIEEATIGAINTSGNTPLTQDENTINIYKVPALTGIEEGDVVDVIGVVGYFNVPQIRVALASDVTLNTPAQPEPELSAIPNELTGFTYIYEEGPSEIMDFQLSGNNLVGSAFVYPSESFEVSTLGGNFFIAENPVVIYNSGHFSNFNIHVRMKAGLEVGTYSEQVYAVTEGADTLFINVAGEVTGGEPTPPTPPTPEGEYARISDLSQLTEGCLVVFAARFDENVTDYYAMSNQSSGKPTGVLFTSTTDEGNEILPTSITDEESNYYWTVGVTANGYTFTNASGEMIGYTSGTNFATGGDNTEWAITIQTSEEGAMMPNYTGFVVGNVNNPLRAFALNSNHNFGPYHTQNMAGSGYNFFLDLFVKSEGGEPPVPPTPTVATPTLTPAAGTYYEVQEVTISCTTEGATIYYSTVSANGPWTEYTEAISVEENMTIWAYAEKEGYNDSPVAEATYTIQLGAVTIFNQDWEGEMNGWTFVTVEGNKPWTVGEHQGNHYAYANGYNGGVNEQWCISPGFNMHDYDNVILTFRNAKNYTGPDLELKYSTNYDGVDPTTANWWTFDFNMSPGSYTWVESGDIHISITPYPAHDCYIAFKYTSTETEAAAWEVDDITLIGFTTVPNLTATPNSLSGFTHVVGEGPSESQYFTLSGVNIGPAPGGGSTGSVIIQSMENEFEISFDNEEFTWQLYIDDIAGTLPPTPVYVRMNGSEVGQYSGVINIHSSSSDQTTVTLNGSVTEPPVPGGDYVRILDVAQLAAGNKVILASRYNETTDAYLAIESPPSSGKLATTEFTSEMSGTDEIIPANILADEDNYYWTVGITADGYTFTNANGDTIGYGNSGTNFVMNSEKTLWTIANGISEEGSLVPNYQGFNIVNATTENRAFALRVTETENIVKAYATSNMANGEYNFFLDIFMQGEGGEPPIPTVAAPTFNPVGGTYYEPQNVTISCATEGATIWYSPISENGPWTPYTEPITVEEFASIWAYASKEGYNDSPVVNAEYIIQDDIVIIFWQEWENDWEPWQGWTERCTMGDSLWRVASYGGNHYAYANGYNHPQTIDWLISPAFDLDNYSDVVLTFRTAKNYNGPDLEVFFSNDYDGENPDGATWISLPCELSEGGWNWVASGDISLDEFSGSNCYIGFKYTSDEDAAGWEVDDIKLASGSTSPTPTLIATPNYLGDFSYVVGHGPSESQSYVLSGVNLEDDGEITIVSCSFYEISMDNETFGGVLTFPCTDLPTTIYVRMMEGLAPYTYDGVYILNTYAYEDDYVYVAVNVSGVVHYENDPSILWDDLPYYIQGNNGSNNNRVPVATYVWLGNLEPHTTYRYTNQFVDENDGPETAGAGNVIYANLDGFYRSTSPSLATEGGYGEFTTSWDGDAHVWFVNEPTANARFTPGNYVYLRIRLNDGHDGTTVAHTLTTQRYATVINFGTEHDANQGSAFYVKSNENPMTFAQMYINQNPNEHPIFATIVETTGVDYGNINQYADFYKEEVAGKDGWFGGILPNDNEYGINKIMVYDITHYWYQEYRTTEYNGQWYPNANTVNPTNGLDEPIFIDLTDVGVGESAETNVKIWSTDNEFIIENGDNSHYTMTVYNVLGQPMMQQQINAGSTERIGHNLATGLYVINLQNNQNKVSVKVIVK